MPIEALHRGQSLSTLAKTRPVITINRNILPALLLLTLFGFLVYQEISGSSELIFDNDWHPIPTTAQVPQPSQKSP